MAGAELRVQIVGAGDAVGSGGRFQTCIAVRSAAAHVLLDCGASSLVAMKQQGVDPGSVDAVVVSHLHGDHFGGIPFLVLDGQFSRRARPLLIAGPPGVRERVHQAMEVLFPGLSRTQQRFDVRFAELAERTPTPIAAFIVTGYPVDHASAAPAYALRLAGGGKVVAYSGDTAWTDTLLEAAQGADLFICEAYFFDKAVKYHLSYATVGAHRAALGCRRLVLTHASDDLLAHAADVPDQIAADGLTLVI